MATSVVGRVTLRPDEDLCLLYVLERLVSPGFGAGKTRERSEEGSDSLIFFMKAIVTYFDNIGSFSQKHCFSSLWGP